MNEHTSIDDGFASESGFILVAILGLSIITMIIVGSFLSTASSALKAARGWEDADRCLLIAQSALERTKWDIQEAFEPYFGSTPLANTGYKFNWFDDYSSTSIGSTNAHHTFQNVYWWGGQVTVTILDVDEPGHGRRDVTMVSSASYNGFNRSVLEMVRYQLAPSRVFDYAYFVNNYGWFYGGSISAFGDVRSNGDFSFKYGPKVHGDALAAVNSALGASGLVNGSWSSYSLSQYYSYAPDRTRPGDPPSTGGNHWPMGYDGEAEEHEELNVLDMPFLGDLSEYKYWAKQEKGEIRQHNTRVREVYDGDGPDGVSGTPDDGTLVMVGTSSKPIIIDGPVVVEGDLIIKGFITGQGTIFAGRNIHIAGDLKYVDPPKWDHPDSDPEGTAADNKDKDLVALAAKGNIVFGDYTSSSWNTVKNYIKPSFTQGYETHETDADIGYDSDGDPTNGHWFDGDYTAEDGGQKLDDRGRVSNRRYFESSNDQAFKSVGPTNSITQIDAVLYTNHLLGGRLGNVTFNGSIVSRDEAVIFSGAARMNWDIRIGSKSKDSVGVQIPLPLSLADPEIRYWREN